MNDLNELALVENLIHNFFMKKAFQDLREGSIIFFIVNGKAHKIVKYRGDVALKPQSENDKPLLIFEMTGNVIKSIISETNFKGIKNTLRDSYLRGDLKVKIPAPTALLVTYGATSMLRKLGLTPRGHRDNGD